MQHKLKFNPHYKNMVGERYKHTKPSSVIAKWVKFLVLGEFIVIYSNSFLVKRLKVAIYRNLWCPHGRPSLIPNLHTNKRVLRRDMRSGKLETNTCKIALWIAENEFCVMFIYKLLFVLW